VDLQGITWDHPTISILVVTPQEGLTWWTSSYLNATLRAIGEWNNAIHDFTLNYSEFDYLSKVILFPTVASAMASGYDVYVNWTKTSLDNSTNEIGMSQSIYTLPSTIINNTVVLSAENSRGYVLNEVDMQNVALHELGHSLGLGHCNYDGDVMYHEYVPERTVERLSSLDLYGVSKVFAWMSTSTQYYPSNFALQKSSVTPPSKIQYFYLPISYEILPSGSLPENQATNPYLSSASNIAQTLLTYGSTLLTYAFQFLMRPEILTLAAIATPTLLVIGLLFIRSQKRKRQILDSSETPI